MHCSSQTAWTSPLNRLCSTSSSAPAASIRWRRRRGAAPNMTSFELETIAFEGDLVASMERMHPRFEDWPVVYTIDNQRDVYVGESQHVAKRMRQHLANPGKQSLRRVRVIIDERFNKSVCLDLESTLIRWFSGDEQFMVMNRNDGIVNADYYSRDDYSQTFEDVFEARHAEGRVTPSTPEHRRDAT